MKQMVEMPTLVKDMFHKNGEHVGKAMSFLILDSDTVCFFLAWLCVVSCSVDRQNAAAVAMANMNICEYT